MVSLLRNHIFLELCALSAESTFVAHNIFPPHRLCTKELSLHKRIPKKKQKTGLLVKQLLKKV